MAMQVAFIGIGNMGSGMAARLLHAGFRLTVYNRTSEKTNDLVARGALGRNSPSQAVEDAEVVVSMLADDQALLGLALGESGFVAAMRPDAVHLSMSTVSPSATRSVQAAHEANLTWLVAAPVLGRPDRAAAGQLRIVAAGPRSLEERCQPLFEAMASGWLWLGERPEQATIFKILQNFALFSTIEVLAEALTLAERYEIDREQYRQTVTSFLSAAVEIYSAKMLSGDFEPAGFSTALALKDVGLALALTADAHAPAPLAGLVHDHLLTAVARGRGEWDVAAVIDVLREQAGLR